jgi:hypothetical protein
VCYDRVRKFTDRRDDVAAHAAEAQGELAERAVHAAVAAKALLEQTADPIQVRPLIPVRTVAE